ncbi:autotransporter domain-containing protein [Pseudomonas sp.]|uniref:autotransporter outer membrane beta-barrel domain-containing protein n=1 Tax=Pseudomonas sp. TaxID=306 RepID=UPI0028B1494E|nr:autotransporter domain-containing protein [Pseudomonas sp.]
MNVTTAQTGTCYPGSSSTFSIASNGSIAGTDAGVLIDYGSAGSTTVINNGFIDVSTVGIGVQSSTAVTGQITNGANGVINVSSSDSGVGIGVIGSSSLSGGITNAGSIGVQTEVSSSDIARAFGIEVFNGASVGGGILNSGTIDVQAASVGQARAVGVILSGAALSGNISNSGTISASGAGSNGALAAGLFTQGGYLDGSMVNSGSISAALNFSNGSAAGLGVIGSTITGGVSNSGQVDVSGSGTLYGIGVRYGNIAGSVANLADGTLYTESGRGLGIGISNSRIGGDVSNAGQISGFDIGIAINNSTITGDVINTAQSTISGETAAIFVSYASISGSVVNQGLLSANNSYGGVISVYSTSSISGGINNSGTITGQGGMSGIYLDGNNSVDQGISNSGRILAVGVAGSNSSQAAGVSIRDSWVSGGLVNSGTIAGNYAGVYIDGGEGSMFDGDIVNSGVISGGEYALYIAHGLATGSILIEGNDTAVFEGDVYAPGMTAEVVSGATYTLDGNYFEVGEFVNSGTLGVASGTSTINGDYTQAADATLRIDVTDDANYGKLVVNGVADLGSNAKIDVDVANPSYAFTSSSLQNVLTANSILSSGAFSVTDNSLLFNFGAQLNEEEDALSLTLSQADNASAVDSVNSTGNRQARNAARVIDNVIAGNPNGALASTFVSLTSEQEVSNAVSQTLPLMAGATSLATNSALNSINQVIQARIDSNRGLSTGETFYGDASLWMKPFGSWADQDSRSGADGYDATTYGMAFGADANVSESTRLGLSFAYAKADVNGDSSIARQSAKIDLYQLLGYGSYALSDDTELNFHAGFGQNSNDGKRSIDFGSTSGTAKSDYDSWVASAGVGLGKVMPLNAQTTVVPSVRADYTWIKDESYHEHGNTAIDPLLLDVDSRHTDAFVLGVDGKVNYLVMPGTTLSANLGVGYDVINDDAALTAAYAGAAGQSFSTQGIDPSPWILSGGAGVSTLTAKGVELSLRYDVEGRSDFTNQTASLKVKVPF